MIGKLTKKAISEYRETEKSINARAKDMKSRKEKFLKHHSDTRARIDKVRDNFKFTQYK